MANRIIDRSVLCCTVGLHDHSPVKGPDEDEDVKLSLLLLQRMLKKLPRGTEVVLGIADIATSSATATLAANSKVREGFETGSRSYGVAGSCRASSER